MALCFLATALALVTPSRTLGSLKISEVGLGTLNLALDKKENDEDAAAALKEAIAAGCNFVDTAEAYGFGNSERLTAWAAAQAGMKIGCGEGELHVATKFAPVPWRSGADSVVEACRASAERLGVSQIPLYQARTRDSNRACYLARPVRHLLCLCRPLRGARSNPTLADPLARRNPAVQGRRPREAQGRGVL